MRSNGTNGDSKESLAISNSKSNPSNKQFETLKAILSKPSESRSTYELRTVLTPLMADIGFFKERKLKLQDITEVCSGL